ncbi:MAG: riboflavin synthase [Candidatus Marinimicrobia bacterium]|nr:riboflavin synthase [Candidatus Neomarinimicrobiota bacterium]
MFSGIIEGLGRLTQCDLSEKWGRIAVEVQGQPWPEPIAQGESIATQGICLTVCESDGQTLRFDVLRETFERTTLGSKRVGDLVNLERSLRWGQTMGGHIVVGHVDGVGQVTAVEPVGRDWRLTFTCASELLDGIVHKGSIGIDGISLTVAALRAEAFDVHVIPFTWEHTTFHTLKPGSPVNLELDLLGKFVRRFVERGQFPGAVTWESLRAEGLIP